MPRRSRNSIRPTFGIITANDFYGMLVDDFDEYVKSPRSSCLALHCATSTYHLYEWVWGDWLKKDPSVQKQLKINKKDKRAGFCSWLKGPDGCPRFSVIEELVNGAKHFSHDQNFTTVPLFSWDTPRAGWGEGAWDLVIDLGGNQMVSASELLHEAVQFWFQFLKKYHPTSGLSAPGGSKP